MKPGMQRDILVAYWLLFDEFEIGEDDTPQASPDSSASGRPPVKSVQQTKPPSQNR